MKRSVILLFLSVLVGLLVVPSLAQEVPVRLAGGDRIETAIDISQEFWPAGAGNVVLARADDFPDALAGGPLAGRLNAPILLTPSRRLDDRVAAEIRRLGADNVYMLGGDAALADSLAGPLFEIAENVYRIGGANRFRTAEMIDDVINSPRDAAVVASGEKFPDALMAITLEPPRILLARLNAFDSYNPEYAYTLVGGTGVLSPAIEDQADAVRLAGEDRYHTAAEVLDAAASVREPGPLFVATGASAPDALAAGGAVERTDGYLLIIDPLLGVNAAQAAVLGDHAERFTDVYVLGGTAALPAAAVQTVVSALSAGPEPEPTEEPTEEPTQEPTEEPTQEPTEEPTQEPTEEPTQEPTEEPTQEPTQEPTEEPTQEPTEEPTQEPTEEPTQEPNSAPSLP